jgi:Zn ribbon nucleic-acid-binding protein
MKKEVIDCVNCGFPHSSVVREFDWWICTDCGFEIKNDPLGLAYRRLEQDSGLWNNVPEGTLLVVTSEELCQ